MKVFIVKRIPGHKGHSHPDDLWVVVARGCYELVRTGESPNHSYITGFSRNSKVEAQRLAVMLNKAWDEFHKTKGG